MHESLFLFYFLIHRAKIIVVSGSGKCKWVNVCESMMMTTVKSCLGINVRAENFVKRVWRYWRWWMKIFSMSVYAQIEYLFSYSLNTEVLRWFLITSWEIFLKEIFVLFFRPTFKTLTPTSRTQLKQQLQREQLLQEAERKEAERKALQQQQQQKQNEECKVPLQSIGVDVPQQILQVCCWIYLFVALSMQFVFIQVRTKLANPTRYHVIQKQKSQVKQFLSESFKSTDSLNNLIPYTVAQHNSMSPTAIASKSQPPTTCNSPMSKSNTNFRLLNHISNRNGSIMSHSASDVVANGHQSGEYSSGPSGSNNSLPFMFQSRFNNITASPSEVAPSAMSPTLSSVATSITSASEVSSSEILTNEFLNDNLLLLPITERRQW